MKVTMMGVPQEDVELPPLDPPLEFHFADVTVTQAAVDRASQVVPEEVWKPLGLHTWLTRRANEAFKKCTVSERKVDMGRLRYVFGAEKDKPVLETVILIR